MCRPNKSMCRLAPSNQQSKRTSLLCLVLLNRRRPSESFSLCLSPLFRPFVVVIDEMRPFPDDGWRLMGLPARIQIPERVGNQTRPSMGQPATCQQMNLCLVQLWSSCPQIVASDFWLSKGLGMIFIKILFDEGASFACATSNAMFPWVCSDLLFFFSRASPPLI